MGLSLMNVGLVANSTKESEEVITNALMTHRNSLFQLKKALYRPRAVRIRISNVFTLVV
jgi:hypothetical protein